MNVSHFSLFCFSPFQYVFEATEKLCMGMEEELKKCTKMISSLEKKVSSPRRKRRSEASHLSLLPSFLLFFFSSPTRRRERANSSERLVQSRFACNNDLQQRLHRDQKQSKKRISPSFFDLTTNDAPLLAAEGGEFTSTTLFNSPRR